MVPPLLYTRPKRRREKNAFPLVVVILFTFVSVVLLFSLGNPARQTATIAAEPKSVWGYVYDQFDSPVIGAHVNVSIWSGTTYRTAYETDSIDEGFYEVGLSASDWDVSNTIKVTATWGSFEGTNSTAAVEGPDQQIDVKMIDTIPEFGGRLSIALIVVANALLVLVISRRKSGQSLDRS